MFNSVFERITYLEYQLKAKNAIIAAFESEERYVKMQDEHFHSLRHLESRVKTLETELEQAYRSNTKMRKNWMDVYEDLEREMKRKEKAYQSIIKNLEKKLFNALRELDTAKDKIKEQRGELYDVKTQLEEEKGKNQQLHAQINRDYENSSIPSSGTIRHKKITNSREKTGRKQGAQTGHKHHGRKKQTPTGPAITLMPPQEILEDPDFKPTGKFITKQLVSIELCLHVQEYTARIYRNSKTGERVHGAFPAGVVDDVNYDGSIKAFLYLLNNDCNVSIQKCRNFLSELTGGKLAISAGMINKLSKELAAKSEAEREKLFAKIQVSPVMHIDCTNARVNGKSACVFVNATPDGSVYYSASTKKGHAGIKDTPAETYQGILVHDHESTFYKYGSDHQECLAHILRYLKDSMENEKNLTWSTKMHSFLQEIIHYRNSREPGAAIDEVVINRIEEEYRDILKTAKDEYDYEPPTKYYMDGYNLYKRMEKYMSNHLLFLHNPIVPATNNEAERLLRSYKRKQAQAVSFRSQDSIDYLCRCMSVLFEMRKNPEKNLFEELSYIFA